jgi:hypothetical protein
MCGNIKIKWIYFSPAVVLNALNLSSKVNAIGFIPISKQKRRLSFQEPFKLKKVSLGFLSFIKGEANDYFSKEKLFASYDHPSAISFRNCVASDIKLALSIVIKSIINHLSIFHLRQKE